MALTATPLLPKTTLLRLDVFPFLICYAILAYLYGWIVDGLCYIFGSWSRRIQSIIQYSKLSDGLSETNLLRASHLLLHEKREGYADQWAIQDLFIAQDQVTGRKLFLVYHESRKLFYDDEEGTFMPVMPSMKGRQMGEVLKWGIVGKRDQNYFDPNVLQIVIRPFWVIFKEQILDPFAFFQIFSSFLCVTVIMLLLFSTFMLSVERIKTLAGFRSLALAPHLIWTWRGDQWKKLSSYQLKPGDLVAIEPSYNHRCVPNHAFETEAQFLKRVLPLPIPVPPQPGQLPSNGIQQTETQNNSYKSVSCDMLLLSGNCVADESILTGEATPQIKEALGPHDLRRAFNPETDKPNILFCGTQVLQINESYSETDLQQALSQNITMPPIERCCVGMVWRTGFDTAKGKLMRQVIAQAKELRLEEKDGLFMVLFLLVFAIAVAVYVVMEGLQDTNRSKQKLFLRCIMIITTVVPPELPTLLTLTVTSSIRALREKKIYVSEPKKIPLGGKVSIVAFDKTGTLTEDRFDFEGILNDCSDWKRLASFKTCSPASAVVLAGCHSLISIDRKLSGDPIELLFFDESEWNYSSKEKQARNGMQQITIQKIFSFKSQLKRMSTIVGHYTPEGKHTFKVLVKGAPEAIAKLLTIVPANYHEAYNYYTSRGFRVLALAYKQIPSLTAIPLNSSKDEARQIAESQLTFAGFFICNSPLKSDTKHNIKLLQDAKYKLLIITGDNLLTAMSVGRQLELGEGDACWSVEADGPNGEIWAQWIDNAVGTTSKDKVIKLKSIKINSVSELIELSRQGLIGTSTTRWLPPSYYPHIGVFARTSPIDKEVIVRTIQDKTQRAILYAGDGSNDVGGLRMAAVGVAVIGKQSVDEVEEREKDRKEKEDSLKKRIADVRLNPTFNFSKKVQLINAITAEQIQLNQTSQLTVEGDLKGGDACIAAPFTSKLSSSIGCVLIILRTSIATLVISIQSYKILGVSSVLQAYSMASMNMFSLKYSEMQSVFLGLTAVCYFGILTSSQPLPKISPQRPPFTIFDFWFWLSFLTQTTLVLGCNYYLLNEVVVLYQPEQQKSLNADEKFQASFMNTAIFLFLAVSQAMIFLINLSGEPHMEGLMKRKKSLYLLLTCLAIPLVLTLYDIPTISSTLSLTFEGVNPAARYQMASLFGGMVAGCFIIQKITSGRGQRQMR